MYCSPTKSVLSWFSMAVQWKRKVKLRRPERGEKFSNNKALFCFQAHTRTKPNGVSVDVVSLNLFSIIHRTESGDGPKF